MKFISLILLVIIESCTSIKPYQVHAYEENGKYEYSLYVYDQQRTNLIHIPIVNYHMFNDSTLWILNGDSILYNRRTKKVEMVKPDHGKNASYWITLNYCPCRIIRNPSVRASSVKWYNTF